MELAGLVQQMPVLMVAFSARQSSELNMNLDRERLRAIGITDSGPGPRPRPGT